MKSANPSTWISIGSVTALAIGIIAGLLLSGQQGMEWAVALAEVLSKSWILMLLLLAIPLVAANLVVSFITLFRTTLMGKVAVHGLLVHTLLLAVGAVVSVGVSYFLTRDLSFAEFTIEGEVPDSNSRSLSLMAGGMQQFLTRLIIPVILCSIIVAVALNYAPKNFRNSVINYLRQVNKRLFSWLNILFRALPVSVGCIAFVITATSGWQLAGMAVYYVAAVCAVLLLVTGLMYVVAAMFGSVPVSRFARALWPAQLVAASTSSSLATLPALLTSTSTLAGETRITGTAVPLFVSFFRINLMVANPFSFFLLSRMYGLPVEWPNLLMFLGLMLVTSFGSPGLPQMGKVYSLPVFLAAGIPLEGVMILKAVDAIPDVFKTVLNVTEIGTVTSVVLRKVNTAAASPVTIEP